MAELSRAAQFVSGSTRNANGHSAIAHAYTRPKGPAPQQPGQRDERPERAADPRGRDVPDAFWVEPEPAEGHGGEREEDEEDVVGGEV